MKREPVWIRFVRPPFAMVGFALNAIYVVLFGWWLDARTFRQLDAALAKAIHENLGFLFTEKNARIIPSDDYRVKRAFDFSVVTIATDDLHIRFITVRGEFDVEVSSPQLPYHWEELSSAIESAKLSEGAGLNAMAGTGRSRSYSFYVDVEKLLRSHWDLLTRYCRRSWR